MTPTDEELIKAEIAKNNSQRCPKCKGRFLKFSYYHDGKKRMYCFDCFYEEYQN